jgi:mevalonate kinase
MNYHFHANGKLLLTGEYLVLQGAEAIGLPLKMGQTLNVKPTRNEDQLRWKSLIQEEILLEAIFSTRNFEIIHTSNEKPTYYIQYLLQKAFEFIPALSRIPAYDIVAELEFPIEWGLGSSSTLISNVSEWFNINPFRLNREITGGSGYDIACAKSHQPIRFKVVDKFPHYCEINVNLPFSDCLYFVYTGQKQDSEKEARQFIKENKDHSHLFPIIKEINHQIIQAQTLEQFERSLWEHEKIIAGILNTTPIKQRSFQDFSGMVKSLGAWGGNFMLITWRGKREDLKQYLADYQLETIFSWNEMVKNKQYA